MHKERTRLHYSFKIYNALHRYMSCSRLITVGFLNEKVPRSRTTTLRYLDVADKRTGQLMPARPQMNYTTQIHVVDS